QGERGRLRVQVPQEERPDDEPVALDLPGADQERVGPGPAGEAGRLSVEEEEPARAARGDPVPRQHPEQSGRGGERTPEDRLAVPVVERVLAANGQDGAVL